MVQEKLAKAELRNVTVQITGLIVFLFLSLVASYVDQVFLSSSKQQICCLNTSKKITKRIKVNLDPCSH